MLSVVGKDGYRKCASRGSETHHRYRYYSSVVATHHIHPSTAPGTAASSVSSASRAQTLVRSRALFMFRKLSLLSLNTREKGALTLREVVVQVCSHLIVVDPRDGFGIDRDRGGALFRLVGLCAVVGDARVGGRGGRGRPRLGGSTFEHGGCVGVGGRRKRARKGLLVG